MSAFWNGTNATIAFRGRPLGGVLYMTSNLGWYEARDTVVAALQGDATAQHKVQQAIAEEPHSGSGGSLLPARR